MSEDTDTDRAARPPKPRSPYAVHPKERIPYSTPTILPPAVDLLPADYYLQPRRRISGWAIAGGVLFVWWFVVTFVLAHPTSPKARLSVPAATVKIPKNAK